MKKSFFSGLTRNIVILGLVSLFTDLGSQVVFPLLPLFLTTVLGAKAYVVGIIEGAAETTASLLRIFSGFWSDKIKKRKPFILFGYSLSTLTKPLFAFTSNWPLILFVRIIERVGKGLRNPPRDALVAESCDKNVWGKAYGFQRAMDGAGSVLGAIIAAVFLPALGYRNLFLLTFIPGLAAVFCILLIKEPHQALKQESKKTSLSVSFKSLPFNLKFFILISFVFTLGHFGYAFLLLKAKNAGLSDDKAIFFYCLFYIVYTLCAIPVGIISDKIGRKPILLSAYFLFALISLGLIFTNSFFGILIFFMIYGVFYAMVDGAQRAFVVDLAPPDLRGTALGTFHTAIGLAALPGGYFAGLLWDKIGPQATFIYGSILAAFSAILFIFTKKK